MQTVNFQCGHCGKLMAVSVEFLGQQVRCPHCQQVVLAPATSAAPAPTPAADDPFRHLVVANHEDIFATPSGPDDALFGGRDEGRLEIPLEPLPGGPRPEPQTDGPTRSYEPEPERPADGVTQTVTGAAPSPSPAAAEAPIASEPAAVRRARADVGRVNWFIPFVFLPLLLYAVLATAAVGFLYYMRVQTPPPPDPFDRMPDVEGDHPGVRKSRERVRLMFTRQQATRPLPEGLVVPLGETIRLGDVEVTPTRVERKRVLIKDEHADKPEPCAHDSLVLHLTVRNRARDYTFTPLDNYFDRHWDGKGGPPPLTLVQADGRTFFGGPARWLPLNRPKKDTNRREELFGRAAADAAGLKPGESAETFVCTNGDDAEAAKFFFGIDPAGGQAGKAYEGPLLWRVQMRRGLIEHKGRRLPAACVVGVRFRSSDYGG